jgi:hypothetical protein
LTSSSGVTKASEADSGFGVMLIWWQARTELCRWCRDKA